MIASAPIGALLVLCGAAAAPAASQIGVHVEEIEDVTLADALELMNALGQSIERATHRPISVDDPTWASSCTQPDRCIADVRSRTQAHEIVMLRLYGGPLKIHVIAGVSGRTSTSAAALSPQEINMPRQKEAWAPTLTELADHLFPGSAARSGKMSEISGTLPAPLPAPGPSTLRKAVPLFLLGGGAIAGATGIVFGVKASRARDRIEHDILSAPDYQDASSALDRDKIAANVLFGLAITGIVAGVAFWVTE